MGDLYKRVELIDGEPILFVGVHALRWQSGWGEPSVGFVEYEGEDVAALKAEIARLRAELAKREWVSVIGMTYADWGDDPYLVRGDSGMISEGEWDVDKWWTSEHIGNVTHYMPLPAPPEVTP